MSWSSHLLLFRGAEKRCHVKSQRPDETAAASGADASSSTMAMNLCNPGPLPENASDAAMAAIVRRGTPATPLGSTRRASREADEVGKRLCLHLVHHPRPMTFTLTSLSPNSAAICLFGMPAITSGVTSRSRAVTAANRSNSSERAAVSVRRRWSRAIPDARRLAALARVRLGDEERRLRTRPRGRPAGVCDWRDMTAVRHVSYRRSSRVRTCTSIRSDRKFAIVASWAPLLQHQRSSSAKTCHKVCTVGQHTPLKPTNLQNSS
jgi:hypothetical protein